MHWTGNGRGIVRFDPTRIARAQVATPPRELIRGKQLPKQDIEIVTKLSSDLIQARRIWGCAHRGRRRRLGSFGTIFGREEVRSAHRPDERGKISGQSPLSYQSAQGAMTSRSP